MSRHPAQPPTLLLSALALTLAFARPAEAQTAPTDPPTQGPYTPTIDVDELELSPFEAAQLNQLLSGAELDNPCAQADRTATAIVPDDCWGPYPSSHYDIGCDEGAWNNISRKVYCTFTDLAFQAARSTTAFSLWLLGWAYGFGIYQRLGSPMISVAATYQTGLIGPLGLTHVAWTYAFCWAALVALRGRLTMAAGELGISIVLSGLAGLLLANPAGYLTGAFDTMGTLSSALLATGSGEPPPRDTTEAEAVLGPLQAQIHKAFVEDPYDHLNWGGPVTAACATIRDRLLATGPHGNSDGPREAMNAVGCTQQADFNDDPNGQRLFGAVLTFIAALVMVVLVALICVTIVVAQVVAVVLFALAPFAALGAILTGAGREIAWRWLAALIRVGLVVVGMSFVLSLLLLTIQALLATTTGQNLTERFVLINLVVIAMFIARKRVIGAGSQIAAQLGGRLSSRRAGGYQAQAWLSAAAAGGATGFALGSAVGLDPRSRTGRLTSFIARDHMADRRLRRHYRRSERRAQQPIARERTEFTPGPDGEAAERHSITVDGPALTAVEDQRLRDRTGIGASARARRTRARVQQAARHRATELPPAATPWSRSPDPWPDPADDPGPLSFPGPIDPEEG